VERLDGTVKTKQQNEIKRWYKDVGGGPDGGPGDETEGGSEARVMVMTTQTGGVGLNLGMTGSIHILGEAWNPRDQEQLEARGMRDRDKFQTGNLMVLYYRSKDTIQQYIQEITEGKSLNNETILELNRRLGKS